MEAARIGEVFNFGALHMEWPTALFVFVVFMVTVAALNQLLYKPVLATLEAREKADDGASVRLESIEKELVELENNYKATLTKAHKENEAAHQKAVGEAKTEALSFLRKAKDSSAELIKTSDAEIEKEMETATAQAKELASGLAETIQTKVLAS